MLKINIAVSYLTSPTCQGNWPLRAFLAFGPPSLMIVSSSHSLTPHSQFSSGQDRKFGSIQILAQEGNSLRHCGGLGGLGLEGGQVSWPDMKNIPSKNMCTLIVMKKHKAYLQFNCQLFLFLINRRVIIREINQHKVLDNTSIQLSEFYLKRPSCLQISKGRLPTRGGKFYHVSVILNY